MAKAEASGSGPEFKACILGGIFPQVELYGAYGPAAESGPLVHDGCEGGGCVRGGLKDVCRLSYRGGPLRFWYSPGLERGGGAVEEVPFGLSPRTGDFGLIASISARTMNQPMSGLGGVHIPSTCGRTFRPSASTFSCSISLYFSGEYSCTSLLPTLSSAPSVTQPSLAFDLLPNSSRRRVPRQKFSMISYS
jgi:hypothetical protein